MKKKKTNKTENSLKLIIVAFLVFGVGFLSFPLIKNTIVSMKVIRSNASFSIDQFERLDTGSTNHSLMENELIVPPKLEDYLFASPEKIDDAVGELSIPSVGIWAPIFSGLQREQLLFGVGIEDPTRTFEEDNVVMLGHHLSNTGLLLGNLDKVTLGDKVLVRTLDKIHEYEIIEKGIIHENQVEVLENTDTPHLTLITCDVPDLTAYRMVVIAQNVTESQLVNEQKNLKNFNFEEEKDQKDKKNRKDMLKYNMLPLIGVLILLSVCIYCILRYL
ncbi:class A sortase [Enterococcus sp. LJL98]